MIQEGLKKLLIVTTLHVYHQNASAKRVDVPTFVYWNPNGVAMSNDALIRKLCYNPHKAMDGTDIFLNMKNMKKIQLYVYDRM